VGCLQVHAILELRRGELASELQAVKSESESRDVVIHQLEGQVEELHVQTDTLQEGLEGAQQRCALLQQVRPSVHHDPQCEPGYFTSTALMFWSPLQSTVLKH
jgi:acyl-CoA synthetase (NDP forming)